jgi:hypothetical protein
MAIVDALVLQWNTNPVATNTFLIDCVKVLYRSMPKYDIFFGKEPSGIAPDYDLKLDPAQNVSEDFPRLPNWNYTAVGWTRPTSSVCSVQFFLDNKEFRWDAEGLTLSFWNNFAGKYQTLYFNEEDYETSLTNSRTAFTPTPPTQPDGTVAKPWPSTGTMSISASYNYGFIWEADGTSASVLVAPLLDTTGWTRPIPAPTVIAPPNNHYIRPSAAWLEDYSRTICRKIYDWVVDFPLNGVPYKITIPNEANAISIRVGNCDGLRSGNAIYFAADVPVPQTAIKFYGNNNYLFPRFTAGTNQFYITCEHLTSGADQFIVVFDATNISYLTLYRGSGV